MHKAFLNQPGIPLAVIANRRIVNATPLQFSRFESNKSKRTCGDAVIQRACHRDLSAPSCDVGRLQLGMSGRCSQSEPSYSMLLFTSFNNARKIHKNCNKLV